MLQMLFSQLFKIQTKPPYLINVYGKCGTVRKSVPTGGAHFPVPGLAPCTQQPHLSHHGNTGTSMATMDTIVTAIVFPSPLLALFTAIPSYVLA